MHNADYHKVGSSCHALDELVHLPDEGPLPTGEYITQGMKGHVAGREISAELVNPLELVPMSAKEDAELRMDALVQVLPGLAILQTPIYLLSMSLGLDWVHTDAQPKAHAPAIQQNPFQPQKWEVLRSTKHTEPTVSALGASQLSHNVLTSRVSVHPYPYPYPHLKQPTHT